MDELVKQIAQRTGIGEDKARQAAETAISFFKSKFPSLGGHLDSLMQGSNSSEKTGSMTEKAEENLGGVFGKKSA
ncbi:MAG TPA: hypothetical protein VFA85_03040 [Terriglobales bacterium]|nr:hypothetical protein [Terriglobales bacterium]